MFILVELEDTIRIRPEDFGDVRLALRTELARNYTHRVLNDVGLVIAVHDILEMGDPYVCMAADGTAQITLQFRLVVFRPALGETIVGKVLACNTDGIQVSLDFTSAVFIPSFSLPSPSKFSPEEGMWYWNYQGHELWFETNQEIRFKVEEVRFRAPLEPLKRGNGSDKTGFAAFALPTTPLLEQPMLVIGQAADSGLGMMSWWHQDTEDLESEDSMNVDTTTDKKK